MEPEPPGWKMACRALVRKFSSGHRDGDKEALPEVTCSLPGRFWLHVLVTLVLTVANHLIEAT